MNTESALPETPLTEDIITHLNSVQNKFNFTPLAKLTEEASGTFENTIIGISAYSPPPDPLFKFLVFNPESQTWESERIQQYENVNTSEESILESATNDSGDLTFDLLDQYYPSPEYEPYKHEKTTGTDAANYILKLIANNLPPHPVEINHLSRVVDEFTVGMLRPTLKLQNEDKALLLYILVPDAEKNEYGGFIVYDKENNEWVVDSCTPVEELEADQELLTNLQMQPIMDYIIPAYNEGEYTKTDLQDIVTKH